MTTIRVTFDAQEVREAFRRAPDVMLRHMGEGLDQGAEMVARTARRNASQRDVTGNLRNTIRVETPRVAVLRGRGAKEQPAALRREVVAASDHARFVEEGTGRFAGRAGYYPNPQRLMDYLAAHRSARGFVFGTGDRAAEEAGLWIRARAWARSIAERGGTRAYPFMAPAAERSEARVHQIIDAAVTRGLEEVFGSGAA